jgi:glutamate/aspartate transport system substrate-binding protein
MTQPAASRRRLFALSAGLTAGVLAAPAIARADDCVEDTLDRIKRTKKFNLGVRDATPPYGWKAADGTYQGFATDIARAIHETVSKELGMTIELTTTPVTGQTRLPLLQNQTIDMEAGATVITQARTRIVDFCLAHFLTSTEVIVPAGSSIKSLADLAGKRVGVPQGGLEEAAYRGLNAGKTLNPPVTTIGFPDHPQGFTALQTGSIDAYSSDGPILYGLKGTSSKWRIFDAGINTFLQAFPIRPESSKFKHVADVTIATLCSDGRWMTLYEKYFGPKSHAPFPMTDTLKALVTMNSWPVQ